MARLKSSNINPFLFVPTAPCSLVSSPQSSLLPLQSMFARRLINRSVSAQSSAFNALDTTGHQQPGSPSSDSELLDPFRLSGTTSTSSASTSSISLRRPRTTSLDDETRAESDARRNRPRTDQLRQYAAEGARQRMISFEEIEEFTSLSPECMLIDIKLDLIVYNRKEASIAHIAMVESSTTKNLIRGKLHAVLAHPDLLQYVTGVKSCVLDVVKLKPGIFKLSSACIKDPKAFETLSNNVETFLTNRRAEWRAKLNADHEARKSIKPDDPPPAGTFLVTFTSSFLPKGVAPSAGQLARFAFLRDCYDQFLQQLNPGADFNDEEEEEQPPVGKTEPDRHFSNKKFWAYVDYQLLALRTGIAASYTSLPEREQMLTSAFTTVLQDHLRRYPPTEAERNHEPIGKVVAPYLDWEEIISSA